MGVPIRVVVVDADDGARAAIRDVLARDAEVELAAEYREGAGAVDCVRRQDADVLFLEMHLPNLEPCGLQGALERAGACAVVFVTTRAEDAVRAFELAAVDCLLKPLRRERLASALARAKAVCRERAATELALRLVRLLAPAGAPAPLVEARRPQRIFVRDRRGEHVVAVDAIDWIGAQDYYAELHVGGTTHLVREPLAGLETVLDPARFVRVHRSAIVNIARVRTARPAHRHPVVLVLADGTELPVSQARRRRVGALLAAR